MAEVTKSSSQARRVRKTATQVPQSETGAIHNVSDAVDNTVVLRVPKPNIQVAVLGLVAFITLFQTFQLVKISAKTNSTPVKVAPAASSTTTQSGSGTGSSAETPQSMVGGC